MPQIDLMRFRLLIFCFLAFFQSFSQKATIRGHVYDKSNGEPLAFATVVVKGLNQGTNTAQDGFFSISSLPGGDHILQVSYLGYDTAVFELRIGPNQIINKQVYLNESGINLGEISISGKKEQARTEVKISTLTVTPKEIKALPATGGEPDIAQYLQIIPGVISTGDQGGQIYIRGGSPVQNKILLDGMTVYNPFHSIGIFSVFETEAIRTVDVLTGGFSAEYGGRISAIVDMKTKDGNKSKFSGLVSGGPFMARALFEGPLKKLNQDNSGSSISYLLTAKHSYIDQTSKTLYKYAIDEGNNNLPFQFTDLYGKVSLLSSAGSNFNIFGFSFNDRVNYSNLADLNWNAAGSGVNFKLIPSNSDIIVGGNVAYTDYFIKLNEYNSSPRDSRIKGLQSNVDFSVFGKRSEVKYGIEFNAFSTDFNFINFLKIPFKVNANNTEIAAYFKYRLATKKIVLDPSLRIQYYASLAKAKLEPRLGLKYNMFPHFRLKAAGGYFTQNLMSSVSERDIVNLFVGFITSPDIISAWHGVGGFEYDLGERYELNVETYYKLFSDLYNLNRNKRFIADPDYVTEKGEAYGLDILLKAKGVSWGVWLGYSLGFVNRDNGQQVYPALFDRRHNLNFVLDYKFGRKKLWESGLRWNLGSGFAFTKIQGFLPDNKLPNGIDSKFGIENPEIGILYSDKINSGRLPYYHRLDLSLKRKIILSKNAGIDITASITNAYNRKNIFYFNVVENRRVNQLPILPSLVITFYF
jgi:hypothetical protein